MNWIELCVSPWFLSLLMWWRVIESSSNIILEKTCRSFDQIFSCFSNSSRIAKNFLIFQLIFYFFSRVQEGFCFHLFTHFHWENFQDYALPEILRTPLDAVGLQIKVFVHENYFFVQSLLKNKVEDKIM